MQAPSYCFCLFPISTHTFGLEKANSPVLLFSWILTSCVATCAFGLAALRLTCWNQARWEKMWKHLAAPGENALRFWYWERFLYWERLWVWARTGFHRCITNSWWCMLAKTLHLTGLPWWALTTQDLTQCANEPAQLISRRIDPNSDFYILHYLKERKSLWDRILEGNADLKSWKLWAALGKSMGFARVRSGKGCVPGYALDLCFGLKND